MARDQQGLPISGSSRSAAAFDRAVADYWGVTGDPVGPLNAAVAEDPAFGLGAVATAGLFLVGGFRGDHPLVSDALSAAEPAMAHANERERLHFSAVRAWAGGDLPKATRLWETILTEWPTDALALRLGAGRLFLPRPIAGHA